MKICHIANLLPGYHNSWGGGAQATYRTVKLLQKNGIDNVVLALKPIKQVKEDFEFHSISVLEDYIGKKAKFFKRPFDIVAFFSAYNLLKKIKPDIVNLHNFSTIGFGAVLAAKMLGIPIIYSINDFWAVCPKQDLVDYRGKNCGRFQGKWCIKCVSENKDAMQKIFLAVRKNMFDFFLFKNLDSITVLAECWKKLLSKYGFPEEKIAVIPLPLEIKQTKKREIAKGSILYAAWIVPKKGLHVIIRAMPSLLKEFPNAKLYALGNYNAAEKGYREFIENFIKKNKLEKNVLLLGGKPYQEVEKFLEKSEVVVVPDQWQISLSTFLNEAMMHGRAIVASNIGGIPEYLHDKKDGLLASHSDSEDFARKIIYLMKNRKKAAQFGRNAHKAIIEKVNEKIVFKKLLDEYKKTLLRKEQ